MRSFAHARSASQLYKIIRIGGLRMLAPEVVELCKQASVEQDADRLLYFIGEINRLIAVRDDEPRKRVVTICNPAPEDQSQILNSSLRAEAGPDCAVGTESH